MKKFIGIQSNQFNGELNCANAGLNNSLAGSEQNRQVLIVHSIEEPEIRVIGSSVYEEYMYVYQDASDSNRFFLL